MAKEPKEIKIAAGQTADLWSGVNVKAKIHYLVRTRDGTDSATMWWIKWGVGSVEQIGVVRGAGELEAPSGILDISYKLRAQASSDTVVFISDELAVDHSLTFKWP